MPRSILEAVSFTELSSNWWQSKGTPDTFGSFDPRVGFGGWSIAFALNVAAASTNGSFNVFSINGNFLGASVAGQNVKAHVTKVRDSKNFATRRVELFQARIFMVVTVDFAKPEEKSLLTYSALPRRKYSSVSQSQSIDDYFKIARQRGVSEKVLKAWTRRLGAQSMYFERRGPPETLMGHTLAGILGHEWSDDNWDKIEMHERTTAEYDRHHEPLSDHLEHSLALAYLADAYAVFTPILFARLSPQDLSAIGSLEFSLRIFTNDLNMNMWTLREETTAVAGEGRSYTESRFWDERGRLIANMTEQCLIRPSAAKL